MGHMAPIFVVHKHAARHLHYDFRLEMEGALKSWAVPKGPSMNPADKRLAVHVEDHPLEYATFHGTIPEGEYGAGKVEIWDKGTYRLVSGSVRGGELVVDLRGKKLKGQFALVRMRTPKNWLLIKKRE
ncbi:MAG: DNA polymerase ligase N-terminal domain-containing protein [Patescibacteria group bacterium]